LAERRAPILQGGKKLWSRGVFYNQRLIGQSMMVQMQKANPSSLPFTKGVPRFAGFEKEGLGEIFKPLV
jgi:hypothetical protein